MSRTGQASGQGTSSPLIFTLGLDWTLIECVCTRRRKLKAISSVSSAHWQDQQCWPTKGSSWFITILPLAHSLSSLTPGVSVLTPWSAPQQLHSCVQKRGRHVRGRLSTCALTITVRHYVALTSGWPQKLYSRSSRMHTHTHTHTHKIIHFSIREKWR